MAGGTVEADFARSMKNTVRPGLWHGCAQLDQITVVPS